jgi:general secretion pathway protein J
MNSRARGFTLIELLLALVLLGLLTVGVYGAITTSTRAVISGESAVDRTNKIRVAQELLRRQVSQALAIALETDGPTGQVSTFIGERDRMRWVSAMPGYLGRGGPYVQEIALERGENGYALRFRHALANGWDSREGFPDTPEPVTLIERIDDVRIEYRGLDEQGKLGDWEDEWTDPGPMPLLVRIKVDFARGSQLEWPELVVPLMVDAGALGAALEPSFFTPPASPPSENTNANGG